MVDEVKMRSIIVTINHVYVFPGIAIEYDLLVVIFIRLPINYPLKERM